MKKDRVGNDGWLMWTMGGGVLEGVGQKLAEVPEDLFAVLLPCSREVSQATTVLPLVVALWK